MKPNQTAKYFTLDWDKITIEQAEYRVKHMWMTNKLIKRLKFSMSPFNGFHVRCWTHKEIIIADLRRKYLDDGRRLIHDLIDNPDHIHDILWNEKEYAPDQSFFEVEIHDWNR